MKLGPWLDHKKRETGLTRTAFAGRIGVTPQMITDYCDGGSIPGKPVMQRILEETLGAVTANDFYHDDEPETETAA